MKLPNLQQAVLLDRGFAQLLDQALAQLQTEMLHRDVTTRRLLPAEALSLKPLTQLRKRLARLVAKDSQPLKPRPVVVGRRKRQPPKPPKPHRLGVEYDELTVVRLFYARLLASATEPTHHYLLATALACFHQPSLTLESHIKLPSPTGPGAQASFL